MDSRERTPVLLLALAFAAACSTGPRYAGIREEPAEAEMREHFDGARQLRAALALGDLERAQEAGLALSRVRGVEELPRGSDIMLQEMRNRARAVSRAASIQEAASSASHLLASCANCHMRYQVGPGEVFDAQPPENAEERLNHGRRCDRTLVLLWEGVMAPADVAWRRGAARLADGVYIPEILAGRLENPSQIQDARMRLMRIGIRAERVESLDERTQVLADVWTECAHCHELIELDGT